MLKHENVSKGFRIPDDNLRRVTHWQETPKRTQAQTLPLAATSRSGRMTRTTRSMSPLAQRLILTFATKKLSAGANGQKDSEDAASPFKFACTVLIELSWRQVVIAQTQASS